MADKDPKHDDRIEDLLGQLQGIFGRLSKTEQEEANQKVDVAPSAPPSAPPPSPAPEAVPPPTPGALPEPITETPSVPLDANHPPLPDPMASTIEDKQAPTEPAAPAAPPEVTPPVEQAPVVPEPAAPESPQPSTAPAPEPAAPSAAATSAFESSVPYTPGDASVLLTAVFFPNGREGEAKALASKIETMAPKFTKVSFRLRVAHFQSYDPKSDWKDSVATQTQQAGARAVFVVVTSALDDARRRGLAAELEPKGIYFQEVPLMSVEKKAFYMDLLLGIVFFFDSLKGGGE